jgi:hypothetical protein
MCQQEAKELVMSCSGVLYLVSYATLEIRFGHRNANTWQRTATPLRQYGAVQRIVVVGAPGSGKWTFARCLGEKLEIPVHERDGLGRLGSPQYRQAVSAITRESSWVFDGFPYYVDAEVYESADTVVLLDFPRRVVLGRVVKRSLRLMFDGETHGAHERAGLLAWFRSDHAVRTALTKFGQRSEEMRLLGTRPELADATIVALESSARASAWLTSLSR